MPTINLGRVKGDTGTSMRNRGAWAASTAYVNNSQYMDVVTNGGNSYVCKTSHTSGSSFSATNWTMIAQKGATGATGATPTIKAGTATSLDATAAPTVSATTSGRTTTFNFGIPKGDTSDIKTPTFTDTVSTYSTLTAANNAAETASSAIKSKVSIFTILSNMKKSFSAIVQGLKILGTNVGAITGITSDLAGESETVAASIKAVNQLNSNLAFTRYDNLSSFSAITVYKTKEYIEIPDGTKLYKTIFYGYLGLSAYATGNQDKYLGYINGVHPQVDSHAPIIIPAILTDQGAYTVTQSVTLYIRGNGGIYLSTPPTLKSTKFNMICIPYFEQYCYYANADMTA